MSQSDEPFTTLVQEYPDVSVQTLFRILRAADALCQAVARAPKAPQSWAAALRDLEEEVAMCPGTGPAQARWKQLAATLRAYEGERP